MLFFFFLSTYIFIGRGLCPNVYKKPKLLKLKNTQTLFSSLTGKITKLVLIVCVPLHQMSTDTTNSQSLGIKNKITF